MTGLDMAAVAADTRTGLSLSDLQRLTLWKFRYVLEARGFNDPAVNRLIFIRWLRERGRIGSTS